jgi:hypothetical protein
MVGSGDQSESFNSCYLSVTIEVVPHAMDQTRAAIVAVVR